jgi:hypothetical protein
MRIIDTIPHPQLKISIFSMNDKYLLKFEAGPYEQTYKVSHEDTGSLEELKQKVNDYFCNETIRLFREMHKNWIKQD